MSGEAQNLLKFEKMAKKMIDGDFDNFQEVTSLLTTWLSKRQAYYPSALLQIVRLLFIAQLRVRDEVKFNHALPLLFKAQRYSENPFAAAYINLVSAILPFQDVFLEGDKGLREGCQQLIASVSCLPEQGAPQTLSPTPRPTNSVESASRSVESDVDQGQVPSATELESPRPSCTPNERFELEASTSAETRSPAPTLSDPKQFESPRGSPSSESQDITVPVNLEAGERDILTPPDPQPALGSSSPQQIGFTTFDSTTPGDVLPDDMEKRAHTPQGQQQSNESVNQPQEILGSPHFSDPGTSLSQFDISSRSLQGLHNEKSMETDGVTVGSIPVSILNAEQNLPSVVANQMEVDPIEVQKSCEPIALVQDLPHSTNNTLASMENNSNVDDEGRNEAPCHGESDAIVPPNPTLKQAVNEAADSHTLSHSMSALKMDSPASMELSIIARQQGLKDRFRIFIDFDISSDRFELIKKWSKRLGDLVELKSSLCITVGCYLLADLKEQFDTRRLSSFEQLLSCTPSKWPRQRGSLSLKVISAESKEENLPLSPPFQVTPDNLLDISDLVAEGRNQIQLHQTIDLRHLLFVLHAHHPTCQQLEQVQNHVCKTKEWQQFLENLAAPFAYDSFTSLLYSQTSRA